MESYKIKPNAPSLVEEPISAYLQMTAPSSGPMWIINASRKGVLMKEVLDLMHHLSISLKEISTIFHLSLRTLQRYAPSKRLDSDTSAKALQLVTLQLKGRDVFGSDDAFSLW
ncbi:MAG: antitoxin Xre-like helix-turn-helix domain-containing protein, partial [Saprospiraceae bacterium]